MPKETFYNLPDEKRSMIENVAIDEFAALGFDKASINTIVDNCGIAKGSFYQYFDNKRDLFLYIMMEVAMEKKLKYISVAMQNPQEHDFFELIRDMYVAGLMFAKDHPKLSAIGSWTMRNNSHEILHDILSEGKVMAMNVYKSMLQSGISKGELRDDIDVDFIAHTLYSFTISSMEYCFDTAELGPINIIDDISDNIMKTVDQFIEILQQGIKNNLGGSTI